MSDLILITGGCRSGKSAFAVAQAERLRLPTLFLATCLPGEDAEMQARVAAHRAQRPASWALREEGYALPAAMADVAEAVLVVDCIPTWLGNLLVRGDSEAEIEAACGQLLEAMRACTARRVLVVSAEVGAGLVPETVLGRRFRDWVGTVNQRLAAQAGQVFLLVAGLPIDVKQAAHPHRKIE